MRVVVCIGVVVTRAALLAVPPTIATVLFTLCIMPLSLASYVPAGTAQRPAPWSPDRPRLDRFPFEPATLLAPMEGVTNPTYRERIAALGGVGVVCTEFVRITSTPTSAKALRREVVRAPGVPLCVQVMGNDVERMTEAAGFMASIGADVVDINLGCPAPRAVRGGVGSAMLKDPELLRRVVGAMRDAVPGLLSAKMRAGFDDGSHVVQLASVLQDVGVDWITVHPRRRVDFYQGVADWRIVRLLRQELQVPIIGNGDVWYAADALRMRAETGCHAVMIGRPAMRNPWIFRQIADLNAGVQPFRPSGADVVAFMHDLIERYMVTYAGRGIGPVGKIKELITWIGRTVPDGGAWKKQALLEPTLNDIRAFLDRTLAHYPAEALDLGAHGELALERSGSCEQPADAGPAPSGDAAAESGGWV